MAASTGIRLPFAVLKNTIGAWQDVQVTVRGCVTGLSRARFFADLFDEGLRLRVLVGRQILEGVDLELGE